MSLKRSNTITAVLIVLFHTTSGEFTAVSLPAYDCLLSYAKLIGIKDINITATEVMNDNIKPECTSARQNLISKVRTEIRSKISEAEILPTYSNCIYDKLTGSESFVHSVIRAAIHEHLNETSNSMNMTIKGIMNEINNSIQQCRQEDEVGMQFDVIFNSTVDGSRNISKQEEYCIKKYLIKNGLIDIYSYDIDPNPYNINVTGLNCEAVIKNANEDVYEQLSLDYFQKPYLSNDDKVECAVEKFRDADYFDLVMRIMALSTINITSEQKNLERENFIGIFSNITSNVFMC